MQEFSVSSENRKLSVFKKLRAKFEILPGFTKYVFLIGFLILLPKLLPTDYMVRILVYIGIYMILALGYNLVITTGGLFSLGFLAFFGIGAYISGLLNVYLGWSFWVDLPVAAFGGVLFSYLLGIPTFRFRGDYLCIVTLAFSEIVRIIITNWVSFTRGPLGLPGIKPISIFSYVFKSPTPFYYLILVLDILCLIIIFRLTSSRLGLAWAAIREDETAAQALGIKSVFNKQVCHGVGAALAAIAGSFYAHFQLIVAPNQFTTWETFIVLAIVLISGGSAPAIFGATIVIIALPEILRFLVQYRMILLGVMFIVLMIVRPDGFSFTRTRHFSLTSQKKEEVDELSKASKKLSLKQIMDQL